MPENILEKTTLKLKPSLVKGNPKGSGDATFKISILDKDDQEIKTEEKTAPLRGKTTHADYLCPAVADDQDFYKVEYTMEAGEEEYDGEKSFVVWPSSLIVETVSDDAEEKKLKGIPVLITQDGKERLRESTSKGRVLYRFSKAATFTVDLKHPYKANWVTATGRKRRVKVGRSFEAEFHAPAVPADGKPIEQLVNMPPGMDTEGQDGVGATITVVVGGKGDKGKPADQRSAATGDKIFVEVTFGRESKRTDEPPKLEIPGAVVTKADGDKLQKGEVTLGTDGEPKSFELFLGKAGGDTCKVKIGTTDKYEGPVLEFVNWRRLKYQVTYPDSMVFPAADPDSNKLPRLKDADLPAGRKGKDASAKRMADTLKKVLIKYERYKQKALSENDGEPAGSWIDGDDLGLKEGRILVVGDHNKPHFHGKFDDDETPLGVHVMVCHEQLDGGKAGHHHKKTLTWKPSDKDKEIPWPEGSNTKARGETVEGWDFDLNKGVIIPTAIQTGDYPVTELQWETTSHPGWKDLDPDTESYINFKDNKGTRGRIFIRFPAQMVTDIDGGDANYRIRVKSYYCEGIYNGESDGDQGNLLLIVGAMADDSVCDTMSHELGHTLKMVGYGAIAGLDWTKHPWHYTERGHQGGHCAFGVKKSVWVSKTDAGLLRSQKECKCIMYGENGREKSGSNGSFCVHCKPFLGALPMDSVP